jgi:hypothetical protein
MHAAGLQVLAKCAGATETYADVESHYIRGQRLFAGKLPHLSKR